MENLSKKPAKGILKNSSSIEKQEAILVRQQSHEKDLKWDEMNILQTLHPPDKDYGHMKIEEPKTPYSYYVENDDGEVNSDNEVPTEIDPDNLAELITQKTKKTDSKFTFDDSERMKDDQSDSEDQTEEDPLEKKEFEQKRKKHYNEFQMVKLARKLMKEELDEDDEEEEDGTESMQDNPQSNSGTD